VHEVNRTPIVIAGGGLAGGNAAATLREEGFRGRVALIGGEPGVPFGRPPLSKTYLRSEADLAGWFVKPPGWYEEHDIELISGSVTAVDAGRHNVVLEMGREVEYQKLLVATGGRNRRLRVPGAEIPGIHYLRTMAECDAIKQEVVANRHAVVVGMGFIGCEVTASLRQLGVRVTSIFPGQAPLERVLGGELGAQFTNIHRCHGVELLSGDQVVAFEGTERVETVVTANGNRISCDFVVVGTGIDPVAPDGVAGPSEQGRGILDDERCQTTLPDVYAAGDVANHLHPVFGRIRVEHYNNAEKQGRAAARSMLGSTDAYAYIHTFWSDQYEHKLEYVGHVERWDDFVVRGSLEEGIFVGFYLTDGVVQAAVGFDRGGDPELEQDSEMAACVRLVASRARLDRERLANDRVPLWSLVE